MEAKQRVPAPRDRQSSAFAPHGIRHGECLLRRWPKKRDDGPHGAGNLGNVGLTLKEEGHGTRDHPRRTVRHQF
jgi:hypothetical protein